MRRTILVGAAAALFCVGASAQSICEQLAKSIQLSEGYMSTELANGLLDNSAPREMVRQAKIANAWASVNAALAVMQMNKCAPYPRTIREHAYISAALKCKKAIESARPPAPGEPFQRAPECKSETWVRDEPAGDSH